jgi:hypothetical protein
VLIDGHYRLKVTIINYKNTMVLTHNDVNKRLDKDLILNTALNNNKLKAKSTRHVLQIYY